MKYKAILILFSTLSLCSSGEPSAGTTPQQQQQHLTPMMEKRAFFDLDPKDIFAKWGPFGYFNEYLDPSNTIGPEILKGFGSPFTPYNGFNAMETITTPPLQVPAAATSTAGYSSDLFAPPAPKDAKNDKGGATTKTTTETPAPEPASGTTPKYPNKGNNNNNSPYRVNYPSNANNYYSSGGGGGGGGYYPQQQQLQAAPVPYGGGGFNGHGGYSHAAHSGFYTPPISPNVMQGYRGGGGGGGAPQIPQVQRGAYTGPGNQFVGYTPMGLSEAFPGASVDMSRRRAANTNMRYQQQWQ